MITVEHAYGRTAAMVPALMPDGYWPEVSRAPSGALLPILTRSHGSDAAAGFDTVALRATAGIRRNNESSNAPSGWNVRGKAFWVHRIETLPKSNVLLSEHSPERHCALPFYSHI